MATLRSDVDSGRWILIASSKPTTTSTKVVGDHSYMIVGCTATKVTLYNPWGKDGWQSGSLTVNTFALDGTNDGFISMTWADFAANFNGYWWN
jgi:hypothetical protein